MIKGLYMERERLYYSRYGLSLFKYKINNKFFIENLLMI